MLPPKLLFNVLHRVLRRVAPALVLLGLALASVACGPPYVILAQSGPPSALAGRMLA